MKILDRAFQLARKMRSHLAVETGETLVETLVSVIIVSVVVLMLATAVVTAARVNTAIKAEDTAFNVKNASSEGVNVTLTVKPKGSATAETVPQAGDDGSSGGVKGYCTDNGYVYYEYQH